MKKHLLAFATFITLFSCNAAFGQITFEHSYTQSFSYPWIAYLDNRTENYAVVVHPPTGIYDSIYLYDLNHTLSYTGYFPKGPKGVDSTARAPQNVSYITRSLFDCDSTNIEFLVYYFYAADSVSPGRYSVSVCRGNGTVLFSKDSAYFASKSVVKTAKGTKLLLWQQQPPYTEYKTLVYSLCGAIPTGYETPALHKDNNGTLYDAYPNPSKGYTHIDYKLPNGVNTGEIIFCDLQGKTIKTMKVGAAFNDVLISTDDLPAGQYLYYLKTNGSVTGAKKLVTVK
ncbi:MAG: T9SS type A sorting domain-containing protein [Bacteroidetes bacterium]|nr:T9SS type A sorting domain-containing protein [Bacteroidota bacterium]